MPQFERARFDHVGIVTTEQQASESWVEPSRVWVASPREHPYHVEFLRFEPDTPVTGPLRTEPHVAYRVLSVGKPMVPLRTPSLKLLAFLAT